MRRGGGGVGRSPAGLRGEENTGLTLETWNTGWTRPRAGGELEPDRHRINHLGDTVWPNESGRQLTRRRPERQILGRKPYSLTAHIGRRGWPATIGCCLGSSSGSEQNLPDSLPGAAATLNESQGGRDSSIGLLWWKQRRFITNRALKRGHTWGRHRKGVTSVFYPRELLAPWTRIVGCQTAEHSFKILVGPLALPIGLRMKTRRQTSQGPDLSTKLLPKPGGELRTPIWNHINRQSMEPEDVVHHQLGGLPGRG